MKTALVIGGGPAGLMAAETLALAGVAVTVADQMPSFGRKFLMAGKSGLNITKAEPLDAFLAAYGPLPDQMLSALSTFGPAEMQRWAQDLGQETFVGSSGRVFPKEMKASPLLRAWLRRLDELGCQFRRQWRWDGWRDDSAIFQTPDGEVAFDADVTILAMGGASWKRLGSDGAWASHVESVPFKPANMGFLVNWSPHMAPHFGKPIKAISLKAGDQASRGEIVISETGIEGGGIYSVSRAMREGALLTLDLLPDWSQQKIEDALASKPAKLSLSNFLRKSLRLDPARIALLNEFGRPFEGVLPQRLKALPIPHDGPRPMDEAISTAGGVPFEALDGLMMRARPNVYCAGEMLDWEAPTGGYLLTGCMATGRAAAFQSLSKRA